MNSEIIQGKVLKILSRHTNRGRAIGMAELFEAVFGEDWNHRINDTRKIRKAITTLREEGVPVASTSSKDSGGYYVASGSELDEYLDGLRRRGLKALAMEARIREVTMTDLLCQMKLALDGDAAA